MLSVMMRSQNASHAGRSSGYPVSPHLQGAVLFWRELVLRPADVPGEPIAVDQEMRANDHGEGTFGRSQKQEWQSVRRGMKSSGEVTLSFLVCHPVALEYIVANRVSNDLACRVHTHLATIESCSALREPQSGRAYPRIPSALAGTGDPAIPPACPPRSSVQVPAP